MSSRENCVIIEALLEFCRASKTDVAWVKFYSLYLFP